MSKLVLHETNGTEREIALDRERITIGRKAHNDIHLDAPAVSGSHAVIITLGSDSFLEDMHSLKIVDREEVYEGKRPYFRYWLKTDHITMSIDLTSFSHDEEVNDTRLKLKIREKRNAGVKFTTSRSNDYISSVTIWMGEGRNRTERKINLSIPQGKFLFHLPFPNADYLSIKEIMRKAQADNDNIPEIIDIVNVLVELGVIETLKLSVR